MFASFQLDWSINMKNNSHDNLSKEFFTKPKTQNL